ncbi:MAG: ABC transporter substrate-binding protein, partial [Acidimicrobiales bacterium]
NCSFPSSLTGQLGAVASPAWLAAALEDPTLDQEPVGTGPFSFDSRTQDSVTKFVKNQNYWGGDIYLDAVEFYPVTDPDVRASLLIEGELDALQTTNPSSILTLDEGGVTQVLDDTGDESFLMLNSAQPPFDDIRARQAITHATPRDNYNTLINLDVTTKADQMFTSASPFYNPDVVQLSDRPELAGPLVDSYCADNPGNCSDGKINIEYQYSGPSVVGERVADLLTEGWSDFFNVTVEVLPQDAHIQQAALGLYNSIGWRQFGAVNPGDDRVWLMCRNIGGISLNWPRYCDEERDALILEADAQKTIEDKAPLYQELVQKINEDYLYVFYNHTLWSIALADGVENLCGVTTPEGVKMRCAINGRTFYQSTFIAD